MGYAIAAKPRGPVLVLGIFDDKDHGFIYVWVEEKSGPRAYQIAYSSSLAEKLLQGRRQVEEEGGQMVLRDAKHGRGDGRSAKPKGNDTGSVGDGLEGQDSLGLDIDVIPVLPAKG